MNITREKSIEISNHLISLYEKFGSADYIGEPVSQIEHMCQCAQLALSEGYDDEVVLAAFFHDIGHLCEHIIPVELMEDFGVEDHEKLGAEYVGKLGFSKKIQQLIASHVNAKRYLTYKYPGYYQQLSAASKRTLELQGGKMQEDEARSFEKEEFFDLYIKLRKWDELAKEQNIPLPPLKIFRDMMIRHLENKKPAGYEV